MDNYLNTTFKAKLKNVSLARNISQVFFSQIDSSLAFFNEIKTIISEAVTNAIIHGYNQDEAMEVRLDLAYDETFIYMTVIDNGIGIADIEMAKTPMFTTKPEDDRSGLGFTIIDVFSDEMLIESELGKGTTVKIVKKRNENSK